MSEYLQDLYHHQGYHSEENSNINTTTARFPFSTTDSADLHVDYSSLVDSAQILDYFSPYKSFDECLFQGCSDYDTVSGAFGFSSSLSSSDAFCSVEEVVKLIAAADGEDVQVYGTETHVTTNSLISSLSMEATGDEDSKKEIQEEESPTEVSNTKKKGEKERQPRFAFMAKSEVDHIEDGNRWRKYDRKAVEKSSYPRCTTQKIPIKKTSEKIDPKSVSYHYSLRRTTKSPRPLK